MIACIAILTVSIMLYVYFSYILIDKKYYDDKVSWYHVHVINYVRNGGVVEKDPYLWFPYGKDLTRSPIALDQLIAFVGIKPGLVTMIAGIIVGLEALAVTYIMFRDKLASTLSLALILLMPATLYWFKYTNYGSYVAMPLGVLTIVIMSLLPRYSIVREEMFYKLTPIFLVLYILSWLTWSSAWIITLVLSIYLIVVMYSGMLNKKLLTTALTTFIVTATLLFATKHVTIYHLLSTILLGSTSVFLSLEYNVITKFRDAFRQNLWRFLSSIMPLLIALTTTYIITSFIELPGLPETYSKEYNPIIDIFPVTVMAPFALVLFMRSRLVRDLRLNSISVTMIITFLVTVIASYIEPPLAVLATLSASPYIMLSLVRIGNFVYREYNGRVRAVTLIASVWIIAGILAGEAIGSYYIAQTPPQIYYSGITPAGHGFKAINESNLVKILEFVNEDSIIITYWSWAPWVTGLKSVYVLADDHGPEQNKRIISLIMVSDEETARALIEKYIDVSKYKVYILVTELVTVDKTPLGIVRKAAHLGKAFVVGEGIYRLPEVIYIPFGDLARFFEYITYAGKNISGYVSLQAPIRSSLQLPLAWSKKAKETLLVRLIINAVFHLGYNPTNMLISSNPLTREEFPEPKYFKLVNATMTYLDTVHTEMGDYEIMILVALYEFIPPT